MKEVLAEMNTTKQIKQRWRQKANEVWLSTFCALAFCILTACTVVRMLPQAGDYLTKIVTHQTEHH